MTTRVRIYFYSGYEAPPSAPGTPKQPYLARCILDVGSEPQTSIPAPKGAGVAFVQADTLVHVEVRPPQDPRSADAHSPLLEGNAAYAIGHEWCVSVREYSLGPDGSLTHEQIIRGCK
jgi:hypothetical protein